MRSTTERYVAASEWVAHEMRNLLTPVGLRLDAWHVQGGAATIAAEDTKRMRAALQDVLALVDGLEWLRLDLGDAPLSGGTPWAEAVSALLSALSGTTALISIEQHVPRSFDASIALTQQLVDLALDVRHVARMIPWHIQISIDDHEAHADVLLTVPPGTPFAQLERAMTVPQDRRVGAAVVRSAPSVRSTRHETTMQVRFVAPHGTRERHVVTPTHSTPIEPLTVLCIDDNIELLDALADRLARTPEFARFFRASSLHDAITQLQTHAVSVILLDVQLSEPNDPHQSITQLRLHCPSARLAFFTGRADAALVAWARTHAVDGFVLKGLAPSVFLEALVRLGRGEDVWLTDDDV